MSQVFNKKGVETVIITLGSKGGLLLHRNIVMLVQPPVKQPAFPLQEWVHKHRCHIKMN